MLSERGVHREAAKGETERKRKEKKRKNEGGKIDPSRKGSNLGVSVYALADPREGADREKGGRSRHLLSPSKERAPHGSS